MIKLIELKVKEYLDLVQSQNPAPANSAVNALAGAQAVALILMIIEKQIKEGQPPENAPLLKEKATELYKNMAQAIDRDVESTYLLAQEKQEESLPEIRDLAQVAFDIMDYAFSGLQLVQKLAEAEIEDDALGSAACHLLACVRGVWPTVSKWTEKLPDGVQKESFRESGQLIFDKADEIGKTLIERLV